MVPEMLPLCAKANGADTHRRRKVHATRRGLFILSSRFSKVQLVREWETGDPPTKTLRCTRNATARIGKSLYISVFTYVNHFFANLEVARAQLVLQMPPSKYRIFSSSTVFRNKDQVAIPSVIASN